MSRPVPVSLVALTFALAASFSPQTAQAQTSGERSPRSYFFGDSDLEQGNFQILAGRTADQQAPYYCEGGLCRDSNGPMWAEFLAPGVEPVLAATSAEGSLNFAVSGAHMTALGDPDLSIETGVARQIEQFASLTAAGALQIGEKDRFFIHAGTNDMLRVLQGEAAAVVSREIVGAAREHVEGLAQQGARTIAVGLVQPVELLPFLGGAELAAVRSLAADFVNQTNADLRSTLSALRRTLPEGTRLVLVDQPAFFRHLQARSAQLGFSTFADACYDPASGTLCSADPSVQNKHVFFDGNHLTSAAHSLLADWYEATLKAADGSAGALALALPEAALASAQSSITQADGARRLMAGTGARNFVYGAPLGQSYGLANVSGKALELRQSGLVVGVQLANVEGLYGTLSGAFVEQRAALGASNAFKMREFAVMGSVGLRRRDGYLGVHAAFSAPRITAFQRDADALGLVARATDQTISVSRFSFGLEGGTQIRWNKVVLSSDSRLDYSRVRVDGFSETGAEGLNLDYGSQTVQGLILSTRARLGLVLVERPNGPRVMPFVAMASSTRLSGETHALTSSLQGDLADPADLRQTTPGHDRTELDAGLEFGIGHKFNAGFAFRHSTGSGMSNEQRVSVTLGMAF
ncbi:SGNH/GDSL hydrolase family protein [Sphingomonas sp.]|uniref:SGNH/GDSL hydrolase family protein n=1 Tax=Sphingomonas sp. TaxID=28214 RepID=UPI0017D3FCA9|nr:SGNH/GDSL hydrolase family protein [Sphingomonas sp.]MBA4760511.1 hypothetical protein [Sphingomonas sp.]